MNMTKPKTPQTEQDWLHGSRVLELAAIKRTNAALPFADPIALAAETGDGYCGRGICSANDGHAGACAEASGWATDPTDFKVTPLDPSIRAAAVLQAITDRRAA